MSVCKQCNRKLPGFRILGEEMRGVWVLWSASPFKDTSSLSKKAGNNDDNNLPWITQDSKTEMVGTLCKIRPAEKCGSLDVNQQSRLISMEKSPFLSTQLLPIKQLGMCLGLCWHLLLLNKQKTLLSRFFHWSNNQFDMRQTNKFDLLCVRVPRSLSALFIF